MPTPQLSERDIANCVDALGYLLDEVHCDPDEFKDGAASTLEVTLSKFRPPRAESYVFESHERRCF